MQRFFFPILKRGTFDLMKHLMNVLRRPIVRLILDSKNILILIHLGTQIHLSFKNLLIVVKDQLGSLAVSNHLSNKKLFSIVFKANRRQRYQLHHSFLKYSWRLSCQNLYYQGWMNPNIGHLRQLLINNISLNWLCFEFSQRIFARHALYSRIHQDTVGCHPLNPLYSIDHTASNFGSDKWGNPPTLATKDRSDPHRQVDQGSNLHSFHLPHNGHLNRKIQPSCAWLSTFFVLGAPIINFSPPLDKKVVLDMVIITHTLAAAPPLRNIPKMIPP